MIASFVSRWRQKAVAAKKHHLLPLRLLLRKKREKNTYYIVNKKKTKYILFILSHLQTKKKCFFFTCFHCSFVCSFACSFVLFVRSFVHFFFSHLVVVSSVSRIRCHVVRISSIMFWKRRTKWSHINCRILHYVGCSCGILNSLKIDGADVMIRLPAVEILSIAWNDGAAL